MKSGWRRRRSHVCALVVMTLLGRTAWGQDPRAGTFEDEDDEDPTRCGVGAGHRACFPRGSIALTNHSQVSVLARRGDVGKTRASVLIAPGFSYFIREQLSLRVQVQLQYLENSAVSSVTRLGAGGFVGRNISLSPRVSVWPELGAWVLTAHREEFLRDAVTLDGKPIAVFRENFVDVSASAPVLFFPVSHLFLGAGPTLYVPLWRERTSRNVPDTAFTQPGADLTFGAALIIGGWL